MKNKLISFFGKTLVYGLIATVPLQAAVMVHEFYLPLPEQQIRTSFVSLSDTRRVGNEMETVFSIVVTGPDTVIHYDHWEDGYEVDINNPAQATTEIWGDGDDSNGIAPGFKKDPMGLPMGTVITLRNRMNMPRNPALRLYDARDRITATKALVVTRAAWSSKIGPLLACAVEVQATIDYGTSFIAPVGEDVNANQMFNYVGLFVMADTDNTKVTVDRDGSDGPVTPVTVTLNRGESYHVDGGIRKGATVTSTKPVQAHLITGHINANYEARWFTLYPVEDWYSSYVTPVGTAANGHETYMFVYNPHQTLMTINYRSRTGSGSFDVAPGQSFRWQVPRSSGAILESADGRSFSAVSTVGAKPTANNVHDWGFAPVPADALTTELIVGWGPGSTDLSKNGSPVWVTTEAATTIYVDYNGDNEGPYTDSKGNKYDAKFDLAALESKTIFDPDRDQTAMRIYTLDGVRLAAAWGQDPATAGAANPFLDMGTAVLPHPIPVIDKFSQLTSDVLPDGISVGDTLTYTVRVDNRGLLPLGNTLVLDRLPSALEYVPESTTLNGEELPDNDSGTPFPLDEEGYTIPIILRGGSSIFTYKVIIVEPGSILNAVENPEYELEVENIVEVPTEFDSNPCVVEFIDSNGTPVAVYEAGSDIYIRMTDMDANRNNESVETITIYVKNNDTGDIEALVLTETSASSGVFVSETPLPSSPTSGLDEEDGILYARPGDELYVYYKDPIYGDYDSDTAIVSAPSKVKPLYLKPDGSEGESGLLDRIDPEAAGQTTHSQSIVFGAAPLVPATITTVGAAAYATSTQTANSHTLSYNSGTAGDNRVLIVGISYRNSNSRTISSVTYNGIGLTEIGTANNSGNVTVALYQLVNPTKNANNLVVTWSGNLANGSVIGAVTYDGVDQTNPAGTFSYDTDSSTSPSVSVSSDTGELVVGVVGSNVNSTYSAGSGGTQLWSHQRASWQHTTGAAQEKDGAASNVSLAWSSSTAQWAAGGVSLKPAMIGGSGGGGGAVVVDRVSSSNSTGDSATLSVAHTTGTGDNRLMLVGVSVAVYNSGSIVNSITYGGQALTKVTDSQHDASSGTAYRPRSEIWQLVNPPSGTANVQINLSSARIVTAGVVTLTGVNQGDPIKANVSDDGSGSTASVTVSGGDYNFGVVATSKGSPSATLTPGTGQSADWHLQNNNSGSYLTGAGSSKTDDGAFSWGISHSGTQWAACAVAINGAPGGEGITFTQSPEFCKDFIMPAGGAIGVHNYVHLAGGALPGNPEIKAVLETAAGEIVTLSNPTATLVSGGAAGILLAAQSSNAFTSRNGTSSLSFSHEPGNGDDRILIVAVGLGATTSTGNPPSVSSVTFGGTAMTLLNSIISGSGGSSGGDDTIAYIYYMLDPPSSSGTVAVTLSGAGTLAAVAATYTGVDLADPFGTVVNNNGTGGGVASVTVESSDGELVLGIVTWDENPTLTIPGSHTTLLNHTGDYAGSVSVGVSTQPGDSSVTHTVTSNDTTEDWAIIAVPIRPAISDAVYAINWASALAGEVTITSGSAVSLTVVNDSGVPMSLLYDSEDYRSRISLPASTVIEIDELAIYDAPYPGGEEVDTVADGATVYIRSTVSDPFGAYDITGLDIAVDKAGLSLALNDDAVVFSNSCSKVYEYAWQPATTGAYQIVATAHEGSEGITDEAAVPLDVIELDTGTPGVVEFTYLNDGVHTNRYEPGATVCLRVTDRDQNKDPDAVETVTVIVTADNGDIETVVLTETGANTGVFTACIPGSETERGDDEDGTIYLPPGTNLIVEYTDPEDPGDYSVDHATVPLPPGVPGVSLVKNLVTPDDGVAQVGDMVTYRIRVSNVGDSDLSSVVVEDSYPEAYLTFAAADPVVTSADSGSLVWNNLGPLEKGSSRTLQVLFIASEPVNLATNRAAVTADGIEKDSEATVTVVHPALTVSKVILDSPGVPVPVGTELTYRLVIGNSGSTPIVSLPLEDSFSSSYLKYVSATIAPDGVGASSLFWADLTDGGALLPGQSITNDIVMQVMGGGNPARNTASVEYAEDIHGNPVPPASDYADVESKAVSISGSVFDDPERDMSGTVGIGGVTVTLYSDPDGDGDFTKGEVVAIAKTQADGSYEFLNLPPGNYVIVETDLPGMASSGDRNGANDNRIQVAATELKEYDNNDFFDYTPALAEYGSISGTVRLDEDGNGTIDGNESNTVRGATVQLIHDLDGNGRWDPGEPVVQYTQTGANGNYSFGGVTTGSYLVVQSDLPGYYSTGDVDGANDNLITVELGAGDKSENNDFFDTKYGSISGRAWKDLNDDGIQHPDEPPFANVVVHLYDDNDNLLASTVTDSEGNYSFSGLKTGDYFVQIERPDGYTYAPALQGEDPELDSDGDANGWSGKLTISSGGEQDNIDFGFNKIETAEVGGRVWLDEDGDGEADAGEDGLVNVLVELRDAEDQVVATTTTDANGDYRFSNVLPGDYSVYVVTNSLADRLADNPTYDEDGVVESPHVRESISLAGGDSHLTADFGYNWIADPAADNGNGVIGDRIWVDVNGDGIQDSDEPGLAGVEVKLYSDLDGNGIYDNEVASATTDVNGNYIFTDVTPGAYVVVVNGGETPPGYTATGDPDHPGQSVPVGEGDNRTTTPIILAPGDVYLNADFGYRPTANTTSEINGTVWFDADADGTQNGDESGIAGVTISVIQDTNGNGVWDPGEPILATTVTDEDGEYSFGGLSVEDGDNNYLILVGDQTGLLDNLDQTYDTDGLITPNLSVVQGLTTDGSHDQDFGYTAAGHEPGKGLISGTVWLDKDGSTDQESNEPGLGGITVNLYDSGNRLVATTTTDTGGNYSFGGLDDDDYTIEVDTTTLPNGGEGLDNTGDPDGTPDSRTTVSVVEGSRHSNRDFGYQPDKPNSISGTIWNDANGDGTLDSGETNRLAGITVELRDESGRVIAKTTTDANGDYSFDGLPDGDYYIFVTDEDGRLKGWWHANGPNPGDDDNSQQQGYKVTVADGDDNTTGDFGFYLASASVGNLVWEDLNVDGIQDDGEPVVAGVRVKLTISYPDETEIEVITVTDENGEYRFDNLLLAEKYSGAGAGQPTFTVAVETPDGWRPTEPRQGEDTELDSNDHEGSAATVARGTDDNSCDFGFYRPGKIHGYAYGDRNNNLMHDEGYDPGTSGMLIEIWYNNEPLAVTNAAENGYYEFDNLWPGEYEIRFYGDNSYLTPLPGEGDPAADEDGRNRAVAHGDGYAVITHTIGSGYGIAESQKSVPLNAGYLGQGPLSSAIDLRAYVTSKGVVVEFTAWDVEEDGLISLFLLDSNGQVIWDGFVEVQRSPKQLVRFLVPGLEADGIYNFAVLDEMLNIWFADGVKVGTLATEAISMTQEGVALTFSSIPDRDYRILWTERLGGEWHDVTSIRAISTKTTVVVRQNYMESDSGFFKILLLD